MKIRIEMSQLHLYFNKDFGAKIEIYIFLLSNISEKFESSRQKYLLHLLIFMIFRRKNSNNLFIRILTGYF